MNITEQVPEDKLQVFEERLPPVVPAVNVNVTVPVGVFEAVVVSATVAVTDAVQLDALNAISQLTLPTLVDVLSFATVIVLEVPVLPL